MTYHVEGTGSDKEMTVTLIVEDMVKAPQEGFDLWAESSEGVELSMARVVKCNK